LRIVSDLVRGKNINTALAILKFSKRNKVSKTLATLLESAVANADQTGKVDVDTLFIKSLRVDQGPTMKRFMPRAQGRAFRILKKSSHVSVVLEEK
jgi:large subunit ribosomal protein L22